MSLPSQTNSVCSSALIALRTQAHSASVILSALRHCVILESIIHRETRYVYHVGRELEPIQETHVGTHALDVRQVDSLIHPIQPVYHVHR
jgi:hypothetical protein